MVMLSFGGSLLEVTEAITADFLCFTLPHYCRAFVCSKFGRTKEQVASELLSIFRVHQKIVDPW